MQHTIFVEKEKTGDFQTTKGLLDILDRDGNKRHLQKSEVPTITKLQH